MIFSIIQNLGSLCKKGSDVSVVQVLVVRGDVGVVTYKAIIPQCGKFVI